MYTAIDHQLNACNISIMKKLIHTQLTGTKKIAQIQTQRLWTQQDKEHVL